MTGKEYMNTPIAVIGFGCRLPGGVSSGQKLWDMLLEKKSARTEVPSDRFNVDAFYHPDGDRYGTVSELAPPPARPIPNRFTDEQSWRTFSHRGHIPV